MRVSATMLSAACICAGFGGHATAQGTRPPEGAKIASGRHFELYVAKTEAKPLAADYTLNIYQVTAVARTLKHGTQRIRRRVETTNSNLLDPASWEVVDFDHDNWDDYRYVAGVTKGGCHTWEAERWEPDHDRFTSAPKYARWSDAQNKAVTGGCIGKK